MTERTWITCAGVTLNGAARTCTIGHHYYPVTGVLYGEPTPEMTGAQKYATEVGRESLKLVYGDPVPQEVLDKVWPSMPESVHFNLLCENGWWIEVALYPADRIPDPRYPHPEDTLSFCLPGDAADMDGDYTGPDELLAFYEEVAQRPKYVPPPQTDPEHYDYIVLDPWMGMKPGEWADYTFGEPLEEEAS